MTVSELIEFLKKQDQSLIVSVDGYEGGITDIEADCVSVADVRLNVNIAVDREASYYGEHEIFVSWDKKNGLTPDAKRLVICR